jgi:hypothetical protein
MRIYIHGSEDGGEDIFRIGIEIEMTVGQMGSLEEGESALRFDDGLVSPPLTSWSLDFVID